MGQYYPALAAYRLLLHSLPVCFAFCRTGVVGGVVAPVVDLAVAMAEILTVGDVVAPVVDLAAAMAEILTATAELLTARPRVN